MSRLARRCLTALFVLFVVGGIGFGASEAFGSARVSVYCGELEEDLGCCPPISDGYCYWTCWQLGYALGGYCLRWDPVNRYDCQDECCTCIDR